MLLLQILIFLRLTFEMNFSSLGTLLSLHYMLRNFELNLKQEHVLCILLTVPLHEANDHLLMILVFSMKNIVLQIYLMCWTIFPGTKTKHFLSVLSLYRKNRFMFHEMFKENKYSKITLYWVKHNFNSLIVLTIMKIQSCFFHFMQHYNTYFTFKF